MRPMNDGKKGMKAKIQQTKIAITYKNSVLFSNHKTYNIGRLKV